MADKAQITITSTALSVQLWVDRDRIIQTLTNLLSNAIEFSALNTTDNLKVGLQCDKMVVCKGSR